MALAAINPFRNIPYYDDSKTCLPKLPDELLLHVFENLRFQELTTIKPVSRRFYRLCKDVRDEIVRKYFELTNEFPSFITLAGRSVADVRRLTIRAAQDKGPYGEVPNTQLGQIRGKFDYDISVFAHFFLSVEEKKIYVCKEDLSFHSEIDLKNFFSESNEGSIFEIIFFQKDLIIIDFDFHPQERHILIGARWSSHQGNWIKSFCIINCDRFVLDGNRLIYSAIDVNGLINEDRKNIVCKIDDYIKKVIASQNQAGNEVEPLTAILMFRSIGVHQKKNCMRNLDTEEEVDLNKVLGPGKLLFSFNAHSILYFTPDFVPDFPSIFDFHIRGFKCAIKDVVHRQEAFVDPWTVNILALLENELFSGEKYSVCTRRSLGLNNSVDNILLDNIFDNKYYIDVLKDIPDLKSVGFHQVVIIDKFLLLNRSFNSQFRIFDLGSRSEVFLREGDHVRHVQFEAPFKWIIVQIGISKLEIWDVSKRKLLHTITRSEPIIRFKYKNHTLQIVVQQGTQALGLINREYLYRFNETEPAHARPALITQPALPKK